MRSLKLLSVIIVFTAAVAAQQKATSKSGADSQAQHHTQAASSRSDDVQSLRDDLARMKALVQQMQSNLGFVDTTQSALKHQFQLEIEMWQTLISQMERRLAEPPVH